jgi:hypothetical protein
MKCSECEARKETAMNSSNNLLCNSYGKRQIARLSNRRKDNIKFNFEKSRAVACFISALSVHK